MQRNTLTGYNLSPPSNYKLQDDFFHLECNRFVVEYRFLASDTQLFPLYTVFKINTFMEL